MFGPYKRLPRKTSAALSYKAPPNKVPAKKLTAENPAVSLAVPAAAQIGHAWRHHDTHG